MLLLSDRSHGRLVMLQKNHGMIMESFPMVIMFHDKHSMACNGPWNGCDVETFQSVSVKVTLLKKTYEYKIRSLCCLFTDVTPLKEKFHSTRFSTKSVLLGCRSGQNCNFWWGNPNEVSLLNVSSNFKWERHFQRLHLFAKLCCIGTKKFKYSSGRVTMAQKMWFRSFLIRFFDNRWSAWGSRTSKKYRFYCSLQLLVRKL